MIKYLRGFLKKDVDMSEFVNTSEQIIISVPEDKEDVEVAFNVYDKEKFLHLVGLVVAGSLTESLIKATFDSLEGDEAKQNFIDILSETAEKNLKNASDKPLIKPSDFLI